MSVELKPCPFCGGEAFEPTIDGALPDWYVPLTSCMNNDCEENAWMSIDNWNTRPIEDALRARAERAENMVERLIEAVGGYFFGVEHPASIWRKKISDLVAEWNERKE